MAIKPKIPKPRHKLPHDGVLDDQQKQFLALYLATGDVFGAYRDSHDCEGLSRGAQRCRAIDLLNDPTVQKILAAERSQSMIVAQYTLDNHLAELARLKHLALDVNRVDLAVKLEEMKGKACGLYTERSHQTIDQNVNQVTKIQIEFVKP